MIKTRHTRGAHCAATLFVTLSILAAPNLASALCAAPSISARIVVPVTTPAGEICIELFKDYTPNTVANFLGYMDSGDWDGMFFHRSVSGFVLQGGGFAYRGGEFVFTSENPSPIAGEWDHPLNTNMAGTVAMALSGGPDTGTNQWFINLGDNTNLDDASNGGPFTVFGRVVANSEGADTLPVAYFISQYNFFEGYVRDYLPGIPGTYTGLPTANLALSISSYLYWYMPYLPVTHTYSHPAGADYGCYDPLMMMMAYNPTALEGERSLLLDPEDPTRDFWLSYGCASTYYGAEFSWDSNLYDNLNTGTTCVGDDEYLAVGIYEQWDPGDPADPYDDTWELFGWLDDDEVHAPYASFTCAAVEASRAGYASWLAKEQELLSQTLVYAQVPEPSPGLLAGTSLLTLLALRRRRARQN